MKKEAVYLDQFILVGTSTRTNNKNEMNPATGKIGPTINTYFSQQIANQFKNRIAPGVTYSVYTDYESDEHGDYTYFVGEKVSSLDNQDLNKFSSLVIPASHYQKFTTTPGKMPFVVIDAWQKIWQMSPVDLAGKRAYQADFEIHDKRACDPNHAIVDIYLGIKEN